MDWLGLREADELLRQEVATFCAREVGPHALEWDHSGKPPVELFARLMKMGLASTAVAEAQGGGGMGALGMVIAIEEVARVFPSLALCLSAQMMAAIALTSTGAGQVPDALVASVLSGREVASVSVSDDSLGLFAEPQGASVSGRLQFVVNGSFASLCLAKTLAYEDGESTLCLLRTAGCGVEPMEVVGLRAAGVAVIQCKGMRLEGWQILPGEATELDLYRQLCLSAIAVGICQGCLDGSRAYARERCQFGQPIGEFDMVRRLIGEANRHTVAARLMTYDAAVRLDGKLPAGQRIADACTWSRASAMLCADNAVQVLGGYGYTKDYPPEMYFRDAKLLELLPPAVAQARVAYC